MALTTYKKKRDFKKTPEPKGGSVAVETLAFVVQKHAASHLHYDFRLEMEGVLKSWAVPKGPSMNPSTNRLAMMVEDHPFDYRRFEGTIPAGNYGAGEVIVWDEGNYAPAEVAFDSKESADRSLRKALHQGKIKFVLNGHKLKGEFILIKTSTRGENAWLLKKVKDEYAQTKDVLMDESSVISDKVLKTPPVTGRKKTVTTPRASKK